MGQKPDFGNVGESNPDAISESERRDNELETTNEEGATAWDAASGRQSLYKVVMNNLLDDSYYDTVEESFEKLYSAFDVAADEDPEFVLQLAAHARREQGLRDIPQVLLVLAANDERTQPYVRDYTPSIIDRTDEFNTVVSYQTRGYGNTIPRCLRDGIEDALHKKYAMLEDEESGDTRRVTYVFEGEGTPIPSNVGEAPVDLGWIHDEYTVSKYRGTDKDVSLHDVLNLVHPNPRDDNRDELFGRIVRGELDDFDDEPLRQDRTWEAERSSDTTEFVATFDGSEFSAESDLVEIVTARKSEMQGEAVNAVVGDSDSEIVSMQIVDGDGTEIGHVEDDLDFGGLIPDEALLDTDLSSVRIEIEADLSESDEYRHRLDDMGVMARVRRLDSMRNAGIPGQEIFDYDSDSDEIFGPESERIVRASKQFPFRYYQAYKACTSGDVDLTGYRARAKVFDLAGGSLDEHSRVWLNGAIDTATEMLPESLDSCFTAVDLSGSMDSPVSEHSILARAEIASLFGAMTLRRGSHLGAFGSDLAIVEPDNFVDEYETLDLASNVYSLSSEVGNSTNGWKAIDYARENGLDYETFVVFTDEQIWDSEYSNRWSSDRSLKDAWDDYTSDVNPNADLYVIDLASYGSFSIPPGYDNVYQVSGWSSNVIEFIDDTKQIESVMDEIAEIDPEDY